MQSHVKYFLFGMMAGNNFMSPTLLNVEITSSQKTWHVELLALGLILSAATSENKVKGVSCYLLGVAISVLGSAALSTLNPDANRAGHPRIKQ